MTTALHDLISKLEARSPIPFPHPHPMSLAPLDVWLRLLAKHPLQIPPRYYLRLLTSMWPSLIGTAVTTPERLAFHFPLQKRYQQSNQQLIHPPGSIFVLGHFRSGTTHLQYLLNCDPHFHTPKWYQVSAPHGFIFAWSFFRLFMVPFLSETRPQDDVSFGPEFPAEDDFALSNFTLASSTPGRIILPQQWDHYRRFHDLQNLSPDEFARWQFGQWSFLYKLSRLAKERMLLLKSPSHTARIPELLQLLNPAQTRFIHLARNPDEVIRSNVKMLKRLSIYHFQDSPNDAELERRVIEEYVATEERYLATRSLIPKGNLVEIHYDDLVADPRATLRLIYQQLNLEWSDTMEINLRAYLESVSNYQRNTHQPDAQPSPTRTQYADRIDRLASQFKRAAIAEIHTPPESTAAPATSGTVSIQDQTNHLKQFLSPLITTITCILLWIVFADLANNRYDWLVWPSGIAIGYVALRTSGRGSPRLGLIAVALTLIVLLTVAIPNTTQTYYRNHPDIPFADIWQTTKNELLAGPTIFWALMGTITAYRFASRTRIAPGGSGGARIRQRTADRSQGANRPSAP